MIEEVNKLRIKRFGLVSDIQKFSKEAFSQELSLGLEIGSVILLI